MQLMLLMLIQIIIIVASAILFAEIIPNAEIAALSTLSFGTLNFLFNTGPTTSDCSYYKSTSWLQISLTRFLEKLRLRQ